MSLVLRHQPELFRLQLDEQGWCAVDDLLEGFAKNERPIDIETLKKVVTLNDKQRFSFSTDYTLIRANQGHSIPIQLGYQPSTPPAILFHGTAHRFLDSIRDKGLLKRNRHHVHLSADYQTAIQVGQRHGKPIVLQVDALQMHETDHLFFLTDNGVWLTEHVPVEYLTFGETED